MAITQSPMPFRPPMPMPEGIYCSPLSPSNCETNELPCGYLPHVYLTCIDMPFKSPSLAELKVQPSKPHTIIPSEIMMSDEPQRFELYVEDCDVTMDDVNKQECVLIEELHQDLVLQAAKANIMLPEYMDSISSSDMSESESEEDNEEHVPLILNDLL
ncbi:hypothetical protein ARMGADRAFT_1087710 [Armillaria gallica]|uniref:Uncharacterized protein n=1 Tax=Armillaria gallica TaxID=47427 RepID=A0A2H3D3A3_ARMGA|nr:hypothetical protein ARMGADRAFT_1087710 [Armillaria gallica]